MPYDNLLAGFSDVPAAGKLRVGDLNPQALWKMERTNRLLLLKKLGTKPVRIIFKVGNEMLTNDKGDKANLATLLILSVARRGKEHSKLVGELIGLSSHKTVEMVRKYIRPSLVKPDMVFHLAHSTARHYTQPRERNGGSIGSELLFRHVPYIIASCLGDLAGANTKSLKRGVKRLLTKWKKNHHDRGIQVGLVLVGLKIWLHRAIQGKHFERAVLLTKVVFGGLSGVPGGGFAFAATQPILEKIILNRLQRRRKKFQAVWEKIHMAVQDSVDKLPGRHTPEGEKHHKEYNGYLQRVLDYNPPLLLER